MNDPETTDYLGTSLSFSNTNFTQVAKHVRLKQDMSPDM